MLSIEKSRHFRKYTDFASEVESYVLKNETAPMQRPLYFVSNPHSQDGRYYWFICDFAPNGTWEGSWDSMACLDFKTDEIYYHPDINTPPGMCNAVIDAQTGDVYWSTAGYIYHKTPDPDSHVDTISKIPSEWQRIGGKPTCHLTMSADRRELALDVIDGNDTYICSCDIQTGRFDLWCKLHGGWDRTQFNPKDKDVMMFAMNLYQDIVNGERKSIGINDEGKLTRIWTMRRGEQPHCHLPMYKEASHEWWSADGKTIYYNDWKKGLCAINYETDETWLVHPTGFRHGYSSPDDRYFAADVFLYDDKLDWWRGCAISVNFYNTLTHRPIDIITRNPALYESHADCPYHIDPHPRFIFDGKYLHHCTTVTGRASIGFTNVEQLVQLSSDHIRK